jgi:cell division protein FtsX
MRLLGASPGLFNRSFHLQAIATGLLGSLLSLGALALIIVWLDASIRGSWVLRDLKAAGLRTIGLSSLGGLAPC